MGVVAGLVYYGLYKLIQSNVICLCLSIALGGATYFIVYILMEKPSRERLRRMPGGAVLVKIFGRMF